MSATQLMVEHWGAKIVERRPYKDLSAALFAEVEPALAGLGCAVMFAGGPESVRTLLADIGVEGDLAEVVLECATEKLRRDGLLP